MTSNYPENRIVFFSDDFSVADQVCTERSGLSLEDYFSRYPVPAAMSFLFQIIDSHKLVAEIACGENTSLIDSQNNDRQKNRLMRQINMIGEFAIMINNNFNPDFEELETKFMVTNRETV